MSENQSSQEKTEQPTPKRREDALKKGDIAQSKDLSSFLVMSVVGAVTFILADTIANDIGTIEQKYFIFDNHIRELTREDNTHAILQALLDGIVAIVWVLLSAFVISLFAGFVLRGKFTISAEAINFKPDKLDPIKGIKRMFSINSLVEMVKAVAKFLFILSFVFVAAYLLQAQLFNLSRLDYYVAIQSCLLLIATVFFVLLVPIFFIALIDVPYQLWSYTKKLRMTRQEVKDELKHMEGSPEVKQRIRAVQRNMSQRKMLEDVAKANAVIVNPDHYAVAMQYDQKEHSVPIVIAKGVDEMAERIKFIAREHAVVVYREPVLARSLFYTTDIGEAIPEGLYMAVAKVLAYIYQVENDIRNHKNQLPDKPTQLDIPDELRY